MGGTIILLYCGAVFVWYDICYSANYNLVLKIIHIIHFTLIYSDTPHIIDHCLHTVSPIFQYGKLALESVMKSVCGFDSAFVDMPEYTQGDFFRGTHI